MKTSEKPREPADPNREDARASTATLEGLASTHEFHGAQEQTERLHLVVSSMSLGMCEFKPGEDEVYCSPRLRAMIGIDETFPVTLRWYIGLMHAEDARRLKGSLNAEIRGVFEFEHRVTRHDTGEERWLRYCGQSILDSAGRVLRVVGAMQDITDRKRLEIERDTAEERWRLSLEAGRMVAWERQVGTTKVTRSSNARSLVGFDGGPGDVFQLVNNIHPDDRDNLLAFHDTVLADHHCVFQFRYQHPERGEIWIESSATRIDRPGEPSRLMGVMYDVTAKKSAERALLYAADHDALTGLLNRDALQRQMSVAIESADASKGKVGLLLLDVDNFKDINDTLGHDTGDAVLRRAARHLTDIVGSTGWVSRLGGDEFAIVLGDGVGPEAVAADILRSIGRPFRYQGTTIEIRASIGIAVHVGGDGGDKAELLKNADLALYAAKAAGRGRFDVYAGDMRHAVESRISLARDIKSALAQNHIVPFYQPKVDLTTGAVIGLEALARWTHPHRGALTPAVFGAAFEDPELAVAIDETMLRSIVGDMRGWLARGLRFGRVAINLSSFAFRSPLLASRLPSLLDEAGISPGMFEVEVTETVLLERRSENVADVLGMLRGRGIKVSLDDFGTGYASLKHLKDFPVDEIKIDRSFVRDLETDHEDASIVSAVIALAHQLGLSTVAEGVETFGQADRLRDFGCDYGQGFLFAKALAASRIPWLLGQNFTARRDPTCSGAAG